MKFAADFRAIARTALRGKWPTAILTGLVASLMGAGIASGGGGSFNTSQNSGDSDVLLRQLQYSGFWQIIVMGLMIGMVILVIYALAVLILSGAGRLGYAAFNLNLVDGRKPAFRDLFSQFHRLGDGFLMNLLTALYTFLWSMLFLIPGIIKSFSYAMTPYVLAEHPELTPNEAITASRRIMHGNRWRLFCLQLSFLGWDLLCAVPTLLAGILLSLLMVGTRPLFGSVVAVLSMLPVCVLLSIVGLLFLNSYREAANAAFYREISDTWPQPEEPVSPGYGAWTQP